MQLRRAQKSISKLRIGMSGPSGSGKTYSALLLASGMTKWDKICVIDTENTSADLYSDLGAYNVITLDEPYTPQKYIEAIKQAEDAGMDVIIIDSATHEWSAIKDMVDKMGGRFQDWAKATPVHNRFVQAIVGSKCHVIVTVRSKTDYAMSTEGGKTKVQKVGLKAEAREGFEYELTVSFDLNINHLAEASKDRTGLFMDADPAVVDKSFGKKLLKWANTGIDPAMLVKEIEGLLASKQTKWTPVTLATQLKVATLADASYPTLLTVKSKLESLPERVADEPKDEPPATPAQPTQEVNVDDIPDDLGQDAPAAEPAHEPKASIGDVKMLEAVAKRREEQTGDDIDAKIQLYLDKCNAKVPADLTKKQIKLIIDILTEQNAKYKEELDAKLKAKVFDQSELDRAAQEAKGIFGGEVK